MSILTWTEGRQMTGYLKKTLFSFSIGKFHFDGHVLKFPTGTSIPTHTDPVDGYDHYRLNLLLKKAKEGGLFYLNNERKLGRVQFFRPDLQKHKVSKVVEGTRYVLSFGFAKAKS